MTMEKRAFKMSPMLLYDVISRQAGSIEKAILEIVQNAIDAKATKIELTISPDRLYAYDDGVGMSESEILEYFEVFGHSFKRDKSEYLGTFGMGRGQTFAQGRTIWRTNAHEMLIDIRSNGLDYELKGLESPIKGTEISINLYSPIVPFFVMEKLKDWLKYVHIPITVNGEKYSQVDDNEGKWYEDEDARILIDTSQRGLRIYNRGIYVKTDMGFSVRVVVITKSNLMVNFARNDIMDGCPLWHRISDKVRSHLIDVLSDPNHYHNIDTKRQVVRLISESDAKSRLGDIKAFKTGNDQWVSYNEVMSNGNVSFCGNKDSRIADTYMQRSGNIVLMNRPEYKNIFKGEGIIINSFNELTKSIKIKIKDYKPKENETELVALACRMMRVMGFNRHLKFAEREDASAWTDGKRTVWLNRNILQLPRERFIFAAYENIVHEMAHDTDTGRSNLHGEDFYHRYYDLVEASIRHLSDFI